MKQLELKFPAKHKPKKTNLLVICQPKYLHKASINNVGATIVADLMNADICQWHETIPDIERYDWIGFNAIYISHILNATSFLYRNGIEPLRKRRNLPTLVFGGQGSSATQGCLEPLGEVYKGELDGDDLVNGWFRKSEIDTPVFFDGTRTAIELDRGCRYRCKMCQFSWLTGGPWRCKPVALVKEQLEECISRGLRRVTFRSANLASYPEVDELLEFCAYHNFYQGWLDMSPMDFKRVLPYIKPLKITSPRVGVESFSENVRMNVLGSGKAFSDEYLEEMLRKLFEQKVNNIHLYLIYGLPEEDYQNWWTWIYKLADIRDEFGHNIRLDLSITDLNPSPGTPLADVPWVNFKEKAIFIEQFIHHMKLSGIYAKHAKMTPQRCYGKLGLREDSYRLVMKLRWATEELTPNIISALPYGVRRSIAPKYIERFFNYKEK